MKQTLMGLVMIFLLNGQAYSLETSKTQFDQRSWKLGWSKQMPNFLMEEYVLEGEAVENWSELITVQQFLGLQKDVTAEVFVGEQKRRLATTCPNIQWRAIHTKPNDIMYSWTIQDCPSAFDQSEIARVVMGKEGVYHWHYAIKKAPMPGQIYKTWMENLKAFKVIEK